MSDFKKRMEKKKGGSGAASQAVGLGSLLADDGAQAFLAEGKASGRFISAPVSDFVPDENQPRKEISEEALRSLSESIRQHGQLQPILVRRESGGKYVIVSGERRWRAIQALNDGRDVDAVIQGTTDELGLLVAQIDENEERENVPAIDTAKAMKRVVDLCKAAGKDQKFAATVLRMSPSKLSKVIQLADAPEQIADLSRKSGIQDVELLYTLNKAFVSQPEEASALVQSWKAGEVDGSLRAAAQELVKKPERDESKKPGKADKPKKPGKGDKSKQPIEARTASGLIEVDSVAVERLPGGGLTMVVESGNTTYAFSFDKRVSAEIERGVTGGTID